MTSQSFSIDSFIKEVEEGIINRSKIYKTDAYFYLPESITIGEIRLIIEKTNSLKINTLEIKSRLYAPRRLQVWWQYYPRSSTFEFLAGVLPIMDPQEFINFYNEFREKYEKNYLTSIKY